MSTASLPTPREREREEREKNTHTETEHNREPDRAERTPRLRSRRVRARIGRGVYDALPSQTGAGAGAGRYLERELRQQRVRDADGEALDARREVHRVHLGEDLRGDLLVLDLREPGAVDVP